jgi:hypothetical protein
VSQVGAREAERTLALEAKPSTLAELLAALGAGRIAKDLEDDKILRFCLLRRRRHTL